MLKSIIGKEIKCLDHGFVRVVDVMGDDAAIVQAARVSYGDGTKSTREDAELINYLIRHAHTSPLEMCEIKLHCKMPIFIARQWVRHRTASLNEYSGRYSVMKDEFYVPELEHVRMQSTINKQGSEGVAANEDAIWFQQWMEQHCKSVYNFYDQAVKKGIAKEVAREALPLNFTVPS